MGFNVHHIALDEEQYCILNEYLAANNIAVSIHYSKYAANRNGIEFPFNSKRNKRKYEETGYVSSEVLEAYIHVFRKRKLNIENLQFLSYFSGGHM